MKSRAFEYYAREVAGGLEDYYAGTGEAPGVWTGRGSKAAGIAGEATGESLERAFGEACHPASRDQLGRPWREPDGVISGMTDVSWAPYCFDLTTENLVKAVVVSNGSNARSIHG